MTTVIPYQAIDITASDYETFDACANRILNATQRRLRYKDPENPENKEGIPIEIDPKLHQVFLKIELTRLGSNEEFEMLFGSFMAVVEQLEDAEQLEKGWVVSVGTPFNVKCPKIPEHFADDIAGQVIKAYLTGNAGVTLCRETPPPPPDEPEEEEE